MAQIDALIAMSSDCEQEIKFEVREEASWEWGSLSILVQAGSPEKRSLRSQVWLVDRPAGGQEGEAGGDRAGWSDLPSTTLMEPTIPAKFAMSQTMRASVIVTSGN